MSELIHIEKLNALEIFRDGGIDPILKAIEAEVIDFIPDISTDKGRKEIASRAYKVAQSKTAIDSAGKQLSDELNAQLKPINNERKKARDFLDALKDKIRKPLTDWEDKEKERILAITKKIDEIKNLHLNEDVEFLISSLKEIKNIDFSFFAEFESDAGKVIVASIPMVENKIKLLEQQKADKEELERLRLAEVERLQKQREQELIKQALERAEKEKEQAIIAERQRIFKEQEQKEKIEKAKAAEEAEKTANIEHQRSVHNELIKELMPILSEEAAKSLIVAICKGSVTKLLIKY